MSSLPASTGWDWLKQGVGLFRKQPAALTTLLFANILVSVFLSIVPLLGPLLSTILIPSLSIAYMQACLMIENGTRVTPAVLLTGFRQPALAALCKIGLIYVGLGLIEMGVVALSMGPEFFQKIAARQADPKAAESLSSEVLVFLLIGLLNVVMMVTLYFAAPLALWKRMTTGKALFYSFFAVVRSARVFLVLLLAWFGILMVLVMAVLLLFGDAAIGRVVAVWLVFLFMLLLQCALYAGYRTIFGKPADGTAQPA
jgi:hypothetical protein